MKIIISKDLQLQYYSKQRSSAGGGGATFQGKNLIQTRKRTKDINDDSEDIFYTDEDLGNNDIITDRH